MSSLKVFVSSTCYDLEEVRAQLRGFIESLGHEPVMSEYNDVLYDPRLHTHTSCVNAVTNADLLVLIIGGRFGGQAVPASLSAVDSDALEKLIRGFDSIVKDRFSITQLEVIKAMQLDIPIYTFISNPVWHDHAVYEKNKNNKTIIDDLQYPSITKSGTASYIFEFVNLIRRRDRGNSLSFFETGQDITNTLRRQWSAFFQTLLAEQGAKGLTANCSLVGLKRVSSRGSLDTGDLSPCIRRAKTVKVMFVSGHTFLAHHHDDLRDCIQSGGEVKFLLASPKSPFVKDIDRSEGRKPSYGISKEIAASLERLKRLVSEITKNGVDPIIEYGQYRTHLRISLIIIDDRYCYSILNYPPKRTSESLALMFDTHGLPDETPARHMIKHFDAIFSELKNHGQIRRIV